MLQYLPPSVYVAVVAGSLTNIGAVLLNWDTYTSGFGFLAQTGTTSITVTGSLTRFTLTATNPATTAFVQPYIQFTYTTPVAIDVTFRIAGLQFEQAAAATFYKSAPGYTLALGGAAPIGTAGGVGTATGCIGTIATFAGGSGAAFNAAGSGGGGSAGKAGAGAAGTTAGHGGTADNGSGGAGGAVKTTTPGNPGTSNVEGGGGGGALTTVLGIGGAGGAPGGGGGGSDFTSGTRTGGTGGSGQIRLTIPDPPTQQTFISQWQPMLWHSGNERR